MRNSDGTLTGKGMTLVGCAFSLLAIVVFAMLFIMGSRSCLNYYLGVAKETTTFLEQTCLKYEKSSRGDQMLELQSLADTGRLFESFLTEDATIDNDLMQRLIRSEHVSGAMVLDSQLDLVAQSSLNEQDSYNLWKNVITHPSVRSIIAHPEKSYYDLLDRDGTKYLFSAISFRGGILVIYESIDKPMTDPYQMTTSNLLEDDTFHGNPTVFITTGSKLVSTNAKTTVGDTTLLKTIKKHSITWNGDSLTEIKHHGGTWYGLRTSYHGWRIYILYPESGVFVQRTSFIAVGFAAFLGICVSVLIVRGQANKKTLAALQKQMRIVNAVGETYCTMYLVHLDTMTMEGIKMSPRLTERFAEHPEPLDFLSVVSHDLVAPESREALGELFDITRLKEELRDHAFLAVDIKDIDGTWLSTQIIPQKRDENGEIVAVLVALRDVTNIKRAEELSYRDKLTGLRNRNYLEARGEELMRSDDYPVTVIMADCNYLKRTNDNLGHQWGDELLKRMAGVLRENVGSDGLALRIGGDEFLLVCAHTDEAAAKGLIGRCRAGMRRESDDTLTVSASFGSCTVQTDAMTFDEAYRAADEAMYREKQAAHAAQGDR